jgi:hypothetical protein
MALKPCLDCGTLTAAARCTACARPRERARTQAKRRRRPYTHAEQQRRAAAVTAWRTQHGNLCPGWQRPAHHATDLTADHIDPVGAGGSEDGALTVLCRSCNSRRGARTT